MTKLERPKNQWAKAIFILYNTINSGVSMAKVLGEYDPYFYKFQSRIGEVERYHPKLKIDRETKTFKSKINNETGHYTHYKVVSPKPYVRNLYNKLNKEGLKTNKKEAA